jgi:hypothetical protein
MKRDGRKLDHQTLETIRFMAVGNVPLDVENREAGVAG